ncbi:MAG: hypothetical protein RL557_1095 [archaeon]
MVVMVKVSRTLREILGEFKFVALDTSVLGISNNFWENRRHRRRLAPLFKKYSERIFLPLYIKLEMSHQDELFLRTVDPKEYCPGVFRSEYDSLFHYFSHEAAHAGIVDHFKAEPFADVKIAAMTFTLALNPNRVAFLSSDRALNKLVYHTAHAIEEGNYPDRFPCMVRGTITPYSFVQRANLFIPYAFEDEGETFRSLDKRGLVSS